MSVLLPDSFDDAAPKPHQFTHGGVRYEIREPSEAAAIAYRSASLRGVEMETVDKTENRITRNLEGMSEVEPVLVSMCTFVVSPEKPAAQWPAVSTDVVKTWGSRVVKPLFDWAKDAGGLDETSDPEALTRQIEKLAVRRSKLLDRAPKVSTGREAG